MKRIDFENHFYLPELLTVLSKRKGTYPWFDPEEKAFYWHDEVKQPVGNRLWIIEAPIEKRIEWMDESHIDCAVLSAAPGIEELDIETAKDIAAKTNKAIYDYTKQYPGRFYGSATLPVGDIEASCKELERCVKEYGFVSWMAYSNFGKTSPDEERYLPIFEKAQELGIYVYLHPHVPDYYRLRGLDWPFASAIMGYTVDTQITTMRMICTGLFDKCPELNMMLGHLGEAFPFLLERIDNRLNVNAKVTPHITMKKSVKYYFENNILVSTSGNASREAFECTKQVIGIDRMFLGTDMPFEEAKEMVNFLDSIPLSIEDREKLYFRNAEKLFNKSLGQY